MLLPSLLKMLVENTINSSYALEGKNGVGGTMKSWKAIPEYLPELVIATEQYVVVKKCGKMIKINWVFVKEMKTWQ